jgi:hypothetical protein
LNAWLWLAELHPNKDHERVQVKAQRKNRPNRTRGTIQALCDSLTMYLENELGERGQAARLARFIAQELLVWSVPTGKLAKVDAVIAFSFGNRLLKGGATAPGPVNQRLAQIAIKIFKQTGCRVFAQWEVAECIGSAIPPDHFCSITPDVGEDGRALKYLSTTDVILKIRKHMGRARESKHILVVAHQDHAHRCLAFLRQHGFKNACVPPFPLPQGYDRRSGQSWTRTRHRYLIHELVARLTEYRARL